MLDCGVEREQCDWSRTGQVWWTFDDNRGGRRKLPDARSDIDGGDDCDATVNRLLPLSISPITLGVCVATLLK